jgi:hypothetical protein
MKTCVSGGIAPPFLISALDGDEWSALRPCRFTPGETAPFPHCIGGWMGPRSCLSAMERRKILPLLGIEPQPVTRLYTDLAMHVRNYKHKSCTECLDQISGKFHAT